MLRRLLCLISLLFVPILLSAECPRGLDIPEQIITNTLSESYADYADFNEDGRLDALIHDSFDLYVLLNRGGVFEPVSRFPNADPAASSSYPGFATVHDQNRDGHADLIFMFSASRLGVSLGKGDGTFRTMIGSTVAPPFFASSSRLIDFNGDGVLDVVAISNSEVRFIRGGSDGTFAEITTRSMQRSGDDGAPVVADLDGDGHVDILTAYSSFTHDEHNNLIPKRTVKVFWSNEDYGLTSTTTDFINNKLPSDLRAVDLDSDGTPEVLGVGTDSLYIVRNKNRQTTIEQTPFLHFQFDNSLHAVGLTDFDRDGYRDLIFDGGSAAYVARGTSSGTFDAPLLFSLGGGGCVGILDFNRDGVNDLVSRCGAPGLTVLYGGSGALQSPKIAPTRSVPSKMLAVDVTGDHKTDVVTLDYEGVVELHANQGDGTFVSVGSYALTPRPFAPDIAIADIDNDGWPDLALQGNTSVVFRFGSGTGFGPNRDLAADRIVGSGRLDGKEVFVTRTGGTLQTVTYSSVTHTFTITPFYATTSTQRVTVVQPDADPNFEVILSEASESHILKKESSGWTAGPRLPITFPVDHGVSRDLNSDGRPDFALWGDSREVLISDGDSYRRPVILNQLGGYYAGQLRAFALEDFDRDGLPDIEYFQSDMFGVLRNLGGGTFELYLGAASSDGKTFATVFDADNDGWNDVVGIDGHGVRLFRNVCSTPGLRAAVSPSVPHKGDRATITVHALTPTAPFTGVIEIREGGALRYSAQPNSRQFATVSWTSPPLDAGIHNYTITYQSQYTGTLQMPLTIAVDPPRHRSARH